MELATLAMRDTPKEMRYNVRTMPARIVPDVDKPSAAIEIPLQTPLPDYDLDQLDQPTPRDVDAILVSQGFRDLVDDARGVLLDLLSNPPVPAHAEASLDFTHESPQAARTGAADRSDLPRRRRGLSPGAVDCGPRLKGQSESTAAFLRRDYRGSAPSPTNSSSAYNWTSLNNRAAIPELDVRAPNSHAGADAGRKGIADRLHRARQGEDHLRAGHRISRRGARACAY